YVISPVFGSKLPSEPWYMVSNQILPAWSNSMLSSPVGALSLNFLIGYSVSLSVFGSNLPMNISPKSVYQTLPSLSTRMSCGSVVGPPLEYSCVMGLGRRPPHVVLGDDGASIPAFRAWQRLELVLPMVG